MGGCDTPLRFVHLRRQNRAVVGKKKGKGRKRRKRKKRKKKKKRRERKKGKENKKKKRMEGRGFSLVRKNPPYYCVVQMFHWSDISLVRRRHSICPTSHRSDIPSVRRPIGPTSHRSVRHPIGPTSHRSDVPSVRRPISSTSHRSDMATSHRFDVPSVRRPIGPTSHRFDVPLVSHWSGKLTPPPQYCVDSQCIAQLVRLLIGPKKNSNISRLVDHVDGVQAIRPAFSRTKLPATSLA